eukprot:SAG11_NODE_77_length_17985_cov_25.875657_14_plen_66_part_00
MKLLKKPIYNNIKTISHLYMGGLRLEGCPDVELIGMSKATFCGIYLPDAAYLPVKYVPGASYAPG